MKLSTMDDKDGYPAKSVESEGDFKAQDLMQVPQCLYSVDFTTKLTSLYLDYNDIDFLPNEIFNKEMQLETLSMAGNALTCLPASLCHLPKLQQLLLPENDVKSLPMDIHQLESLQCLNILGNKVTEFPALFGNLSSLQQLYADENQLASLPESFGCLKNLLVLEMSYNNLTRLSENFGALEKLQILNLSNNQLQDYLPDSFCELACLIELDISHNRLKALPSTFKAQVCIKKFYCEVNTLEVLPNWIGYMPSIEEFAIKDNHLQGSIFPEDFGKNNTNLKIFEVGGNFLTDLPDSLGQLVSLEMIHIGSVIDELERRNFQNGNWIPSLPSSFSQLGHLREAILNENQLGKVPDDIGNLVSLEILDLGQNQIRELPPSFTQLKQLRWCQLSKNHIHSLPESMGDLQALQDLRIDNNQLQELPDSMRQLTCLHTLDIFNNDLEEIPPILESLINLKRLDMDQNKFGLEWYEVPNVRVQASYTPKDPSKKDNWRGRPRQDLIDLEVTKLPDSIHAEDSPEDVPYNYNTLQHAMKQSLSLWKSHGDKKEAKREVYTGHQVCKGDAGLPACCGDEDWEADEAGNSSTDEAGESNTDRGDEEAVLGNTSFTMPNTDNCVESTEDWSEDLVDVPLRDVFCNGMLTGHAVPARAFGLSEEHYFIPGNNHTTSIQQQAARNQPHIIQGQFDDVDI